MASSIFNTLFLIIYLLSAAVQYNDPDAARWIIIYLSAAGMCVLQFRNIRTRWVPRLLLIISLVWIGTLVPHILGKTTLAEIFASISMQTREVEEAREIGGLLLVALWSGVLGFRRASR